MKISYIVKNVLCIVLAHQALAVIAAERKEAVGQFVKMIGKGVIEIQHNKQLVMLRYCGVILAPFNNQHRRYDSVYELIAAVPVPYPKRWVWPLGGLKLYPINEQLRLNIIR